MPINTGPSKKSFSVGQSRGQKPVGQSINQPMNQPMNQPLNQSLGQRLNPMPQMPQMPMMNPQPMMGGNPMMGRGFLPGAPNGMPPPIASPNMPIDVTPTNYMNPPNAVIPGMGGNSQMGGLRSAYGGSPSPQPFGMGNRRF